MQERIKEVNDELLRKFKKQETKVEKQIQEIYFNHLLKDGMIGPEDDCPYPSIMTYVTEKVPVLDKKLKKNTEDIT
jgi:hypothetical protein